MGLAGDMEKGYQCREVLIKDKRIFDGELPLPEVAELDFEEATCLLQSGARYSDQDIFFCHDPTIASFCNRVDQLRTDVRDVSVWIEACDYVVSLVC